MFKIISFAFRFAPFIFIGVQAIEAVMSDKSGEEKKAALVAALTSIAQRIGIEVTDARARLVSEAIDLVVAIFNITGAFNRPEEEIAEVQAAIASETTARLDELEAELTQ